MKLEDKYKWLARDEDGELWAYTEKPSKIGDVIWDVTEDVEYYSAVIYEEDETYSFIKWESENPMTIGDVEEQLKFNEYLSNQKEIGEAKDNVNKPNHYHSGNIDVIKFSEENFSKEEQKGFHRINAIKYITRYDRKNGVEDLNKAKFYIDKLIEMEESE